MFADDCLLLLGCRWNELLRHHDVLGHESLGLSPLLVLQVPNEVVVEVSLAGFLQRFEQEVLVVNHEFLDFSFIKSLVLEFTLIHFANASAVEVLAGESSKIVRERTLGRPSMAVSSQCKLAQLIDLGLRLLAGGL